MTSVAGGLLRPVLKGAAEAPENTTGGTASLLPGLAIALIAVAAVVGYALTYSHYLDMAQYPVVRSDGVGYYAYLPGWLLDHDPSLRTFVTRDAHALPLDQLGFTSFPDHGSYLDRYPVGEAIMILPFFVVGHLMAMVLGQTSNGFSTGEQLASGLAGVTYMVMGLWVLSITLRRRFSPLVVATTLLSVTFGSNLFHYGTFDSMVSHAFTFFLVAVLIEVTYRWHTHPSRGTSVALGATLGMIVLVRNPNAVLVLVPLLYNMSVPNPVRARLSLLRHEVGSIAVVAGTSAIVFVPQLVVWHVATGSWVVNSYGQYGFNFASPRVVQVLFSLDPHGFLLWSPVMCLAILGVPFVRRHAPEMLWPLCVILPVSVYMVASWSIWFYGGGYGHRGFVDIFPVLAFGLASLFASLRSALARVAVTALTVACCGLVTVQMLHYWKLMLPFNGADASTYIRVLTKPLW